MNDFSNSVRQLVEGYVKIDAYQYSKKQIDYLLKSYLPLLTIIVAIVLIVKK